MECHTYKCQKILSTCRVTMRKNTRAYDSNRHGTGYAQNFERNGRERWKRTMCTIAPAATCWTSIASENVNTFGCASHSSVCNNTHTHTPYAAWSRRNERKITQQVECLIVFSGVCVLCTLCLNCWQTYIAHSTHVFFHPAAVHESMLDR